METINLIKVIIDPHNNPNHKSKPNPINDIGITQVEIGGTLINNIDVDPFASKIKLIFNFKG